MNDIDPFVSLAKSYEDWHLTSLGQYVDSCELGALATSLEGVNSSSVIEIGAGTGHVARFLSGRSSLVTAIEPSEAMRAEGLRRTGDLSIRWIDARAEQLPCPDASFDGAVFFTALEFVADPPAALQESLRVVRPGGWVIVGLLNALSVWTALYRYKADRGVMPWTAARFATRKEVEGWMGFAAEQSNAAIYLSPQATEPFDEADRAGRRAGNPPALEVLRWKKLS